MGVVGRKLAGELPILHVKILETTITSYECMLRKKEGFTCHTGQNNNFLSKSTTVIGCITNFYTNFVKSRSYEYMGTECFLVTKIHEFQSVSNLLYATTHQFIKN